MTIAKSDPRRSLPGVRLHGTGWQAYRQVRGVPKYSPTLPIEATVAELVAAWEKLAGVAVEAVAGSLAEAVVEYLPTISAMPSASQKAAHLAIMLEALGRDRRLTSVEPDEIDVIIQAWQKTRVVKVKGKRGRPPAGGVLGDESIRKRLGAWQKFFQVKLPKGAMNPVAACTRRPAPKPAETRGIPIADVARILAAMPESLAKRRATVTAYTGLDPAQVGALKPTDLILEGDRPSVRIGRNKGDGVAIQVIPLTEAGRLALVAFAAAQAFGPYVAGTVNRAVRRAAERVEIFDFHQKDLRHSFLTELYRLTRDQATVARFALHAEGSQHTARYTRAAHEEVDHAAAAKFRAPLEREPAPVLRFAGRKARS
jgi:integrase